LASEAIATFVARELAVVEGIGRGLSDMYAERVIPHKQAMRRLKITISRVAKKRS